MDTSALDRRIDTQWDGDIVPQITEYIRVPAKSPHFDPAWEANGHVERVITQALAWVRAQPVAGLRAEIVRIPKRTPLLFIEVPEPKSVKNRIHFDLRSTDVTQDEEYERLVGLGATLVADRRGLYGPGTGWYVMADPEGNEFCILKSDAEYAAALAAKSHSSE